MPFMDEEGNVTDNSDCLYTTDSNGRITHDDHQGLDISYNVLNFPCRFYDVDAMTETSYTYISDGSKRSVSTHDGLGKLYRGSFVYDGGSDVGSSVSWESIATPEGRLVNTDNGIMDLWYAKDYLGNVRSVIDLASGVIEENDYLPFGMRIQDDNQPVMSDNRWRYANKEEQSSLVGGSCNLIDFGARNYDPWSARWTTTDPMAQKYYSMSPYNYCAGNPVMLVDPDGMDWYKADSTDIYTWFDGNSMHDGYQHVGGMGSLLGEFEVYVNEVLSSSNSYDCGGLYVDGRTIGFASNSQGIFAHDKSNVGLFTEFVNNIGPEIKVFWADHPFTKDIRQYSYVQKALGTLLSLGTEVEGQINNVLIPFGVFRALKNVRSPARSFLGSARYDAYMDENDNVLNIITDAKSRTSFFLHLPIENKSRSACNKFGNVYHIYLWKEQICH